jgi:Restriction endonuclease S subunits
MFKGAALKHLQKKQFKNIKINVPTLAEQQRIVAKLDAAFAGIDREVQNTNEIINLSNTNLKKIIDDKTKGNDSWIEFKVKDLGIVKTGSTPKTSEKGNYGSEIPFVKPPHFNSDGSITITDVGLSKKGSKLSRNAPANSVLMVCIGATIGKVGINNIDVCFNQQINSVTTSDKFDAELIYWQMRGKRFQNDVIQNAGQATLPIINKSKWQNLSIFLPESLNKQIEIRTLLRKINIETENFINNKLQKIQNLYALKTAIHEKALLQSEAA